MKSFKSSRPDSIDEDDDTYFYCRKMAFGREHMSIHVGKTIRTHVSEAKVDHIIICARYSIK